MTTAEDRSPRYGAKAFTCPVCSAYSSVTWVHLQAGNGPAPVDIARCLTCGENTVWQVTLTPADPPPPPTPRPGDNTVIVGRPPPGGYFTRTGVMIWPPERGGVPPAHDMPERVRQVYNEARDVAQASPRAAAALLRLALDVLLRDLLPGKTGSLNDLIGAAVKAGVSPQVQVAADLLRINGNDAVHPGIIPTDEEAAEQPDALVQVARLCFLLNFIVEQMITTPNMLAQMTACCCSRAPASPSVPQPLLEKIAKRDGKS